MTYSNFCYYFNLQTAQQNRSFLVEQFIFLPERQRHLVAGPANIPNLPHVAPGNRRYDVTGE